MDPPQPLSLQLLSAAISPFSLESRFLAFCPGTSSVHRGARTIHLGVRALPPCRKKPAVDRGDRRARAWDGGSAPGPAAGPGGWPHTRPGASHPSWAAFHPAFHPTEQVMLPSRWTVPTEGPGSVACCAAHFCPRRPPAHPLLRDLPGWEPTLPAARTPGTQAAAQQKDVLWEVQWILAKGCPGARATTVGPRLIFEALLGGKVWTLAQGCRFKPRPSVHWHQRDVGRGPWVSEPLLPQLHGRSRAQRPGVCGRGMRWGSSPEPGCCAFPLLRTASLGFAPSLFCSHPETRDSKSSNPHAFTFKPPPPAGPQPRPRRQGEGGHPLPAPDPPLLLSTPPSLNSRLNVAGSSRSSARPSRQGEGAALKVTSASEAQRDAPSTQGTRAPSRPLGRDQNRVEVSCGAGQGPA